MKKYWIAVMAILFIASLWFVKGHYDQEGRFIAKYEKENSRLKLLAERRELQFKIAAYESKLNLRAAKEVKKPAKSEPADPNE